MSLPPCPRCEGQHLYALTFAHDVRCDLYSLDSATAAADHDRVRGVRPMTTTERILTDDQYDEPGEGLDLAVAFTHTGIHQRRVVVVDASGRYVSDAEQRGDLDA